jgi:hypothetical protein
MNKRSPVGLIVEKQGYQLSRAAAFGPLVAG